MSPIFWWVLLAVGTFLALLLITAVVGGRHQSPKTFCLFASSAVEVNERSLGDTPCHGPADWVFIGLSDETRHFTGTKACHRHAPDLVKLTGAMETGAESYWLVPKAWASDKVVK